MTIDSSLQNFIETFQKSKRSMGVMSYSEENLGCSNHDIPLHGDMLYFYEHTILEDKPTFGGDFFIQIIEMYDLGNIQSGWLIPNGTNDWDKNYVIFAERNGDVLFCDVLDDNSAVYGSVQKKVYKLTNTLGDFLDTYSALIELEDSEFECDTTDDDFNYKNEYLLRVKEVLSNNLPTELVDNYMCFFFG
ncbi:hypothetical protein ACEYZD_000482 [Klebsiella aerogenes]|uniref:hypothetical protein n=2 Tax=Klebsiella aerogenes TaxID=548 RepID=UPI000E3508AC|nr:hypothetical protein [Klebsiella aerogenes]RFS93535.1 hypothetical protein CH426_14655 [Klebsiella aerogenes]WPS20050.1 hypothetical protein SM903_09260 [Klebsiella aerogenes]